jgi:hypothetical protein
MAAQSMMDMNRAQLEWATLPQPAQQVQQPHRIEPTAQAEFQSTLAGQYVRPMAFDYG